MLMKCLSSTEILEFPNVMQGHIVGNTEKQKSPQCLIGASCITQENKKLPNAPKGYFVICFHTQLDPDIRIKNDPEMMSKGKDQQLERAVQEIQKSLAKKY